MEDVWISLEARAEEVPASAGIYRLYQGTRLLHIGMAAGAATLRSEVLGHARGDYGPATQRADRIEWVISPDDHFAYEQFVELYAAATYTARGAEEDDLAPSASGRLTPPRSD